MAVPLVATLLFVLLQSAGVGAAVEAGSGESARPPLVALRASGTFVATHSGAEEVSLECVNTTGHALLVEVMPPGCSCLISRQSNYRVAAGAEVRILLTVAWPKVVDERLETLNLMCREDGTTGKAAQVSIPVILRANKGIVCSPPQLAFCVHPDESIEHAFSIVVKCERSAGPSLDWSMPEARGGVSLFVSKHRSYPAMQFDVHVYDMALVVDFSCSLSTSIVAVRWSHGDGSGPRLCHATDIALSVRKRR